MRETVFWEDAVRLPSQRLYRRKIRYGPIMWVAPLAAFACAYFYSDIAALFVQPEQRYMSADNPWSKDYQPDRSQAFSGPTYFPNCTAAKAAGYRNIPRDHPAYRPQLDEDNDGRACEPYRGR